MDLKKKKSDFLEHIENTLTDNSSFEELFDTKDEEFWLSFIEDSDNYDVIEEHIGEDEYSYFVNDYLKAIEVVLKSLDENDFYDFVEEFMSDTIDECSKESIDSFFEWN